MFATSIHGHICVWFKYDLGQKYYAPQVRPNRGSNSRPPDHDIQTIEISSINFCCFVVVGILIWYHNKQHFELSDIVITRDYCMFLRNQLVQKKAK